MSTIPEILDEMSYGPAPESPAEAQSWLEGHSRKFGVFINGEWQTGATHFESTNPASMRSLALISQASSDQVNGAVIAARQAQPGWWKIGPFERAKVLYALARQIQKHSRLFAVLETLDNGKPIRESRDIDIPLVVRHFYHHAGWAQLMTEEMPTAEPIGVVGQIIPWNFPLLMLAWKVAPALAMGNTVVLKPAEYTSLTALLFAEISLASGVPPGVLNIVTGDGTVGEMIVRHPGIDNIAFTGSTEVGRIIRETTADTPKRLSLELGGKSPFVVMEDADLDSVVEGVVDAIWFNQGEVCCAGSRLLVQEGVAERLISKLKARMSTLRVGDPMDKSIDVGAIVAPIQVDRMAGLVEAGVQEGAEAFQAANGVPKEGCFYPPTLITGVSPSSTVVQEEIFGPVLVAMTFRTPEEAVELANNTKFGLAASVWSENINVALDLARQIKAGTVWINSTNVFDGASGFGGYRQSGFGREGGKEGLYEYVRLPDRQHQDPGKASLAEGQRSEVDRTAKLFIGGKQVRPDSGYSQEVTTFDGREAGEVGLGNRKDIRNAVEAAHAAHRWSETTGHQRAQILYFLAENFSIRSDEFAARVSDLCGTDGKLEASLALESLFKWAAWADKFDGAVHDTAGKQVTLAMTEPIGVLGIVCPNDWPLCRFVESMGSALATGNRVVMVPSKTAPLVATDFYQILETSDMPAGVVNIVTGITADLAAVLADHMDVDAIWAWVPAELRTDILRRSAGNLKRTWINEVPQEDREWLRQATQVKNIWIPYGA